MNGSIIDRFAPLYVKYKHKPIMISEGAIAHTVLETDKSYGSWAESQLGYMFGLLPRMFPQVKAITYFNFSRSQALRTHMEYVYDLGENLYTDGLYRRLITSRWFLDTIQEGASSVDYTYTPMDKAYVPSGKQTVMVYMKPQEGLAPFAVALYQGDRRLGIRYEMPWEFETNLTPEQASIPVRAVAYHRDMTPAAAASFQPAPGLK